MSKRPNVKLARSLLKHLGVAPGAAVVYRPADFGGFLVMIMPSTVMEEKPDQWFGFPVKYERMPKAYPQKGSSKPN